MSDSGESDEAERSSDLDAIAEALRAGELDAETRFGERRSEQADDQSKESDGRSPSDILTDVQARDDEADQNEGRATIDIELVLRMERDELVPEKMKEQLLQGFSPDLPPESVRIHDITPYAEEIEVHMTVSIDSDAVVDELLSDSQSDDAPEARVKRVT
jgi:hypothetical protein